MAEFPIINILLITDWEYKINSIWIIHPRLWSCQQLASKFHSVKLSISESKPEVNRPVDWSSASYWLAPRALIGWEEAAPGQLSPHSLPHFGRGTALSAILRSEHYETQLLVIVRESVFSWEAVLQAQTSPTPAWIIHLINFISGRIYNLKYLSWFLYSVERVLSCDLMQRILTHLVWLWEGEL